MVNGDDDSCLRDRDLGFNKHMASIPYFEILYLLEFNIYIYIYYNHFYFDRMIVRIFNSCAIFQLLYNLEK